MYLHRKVGESVVINDNIELTVIEVKGRSVKLGFVFPPSATIMRKEVFEKVRDENLQAGKSSGDDFFSAFTKKDGNE